MQLSPAQAAALQHLLQLRTAAGCVIGANLLAAANLRQPLRQRVRLVPRCRWQLVLVLALVLELELHWTRQLALQLLATL